MNVRVLKEVRKFKKLWGVKYVGYDKHKDYIELEFYNNNNDILREDITIRWFFKEESISEALDRASERLREAIRLEYMNAANYITK